jgi:hypothetical protein
MLMLHRRVIAAFLLSAGVVLSACSGPAPGESFMPQRQPEMVHALSPAQLPARKLYVANFSSVDIFTAGVTNPTLAGHITDGARTAVDVAVDAQGTLYVLNSNSIIDYVAVYPAGSMHPSRYIPFGNVLAQWITVGGDGTIYVSSVSSVLEIDSGATKVSRTIRMPIGCGNYEGGTLMASGVAVDRNNNLYVQESWQCDLTTIYRYAPKATAPNGKIVSYLGYQGGLTYDSRDNTLIAGNPATSSPFEVAPLPSGEPRTIPASGFDGQYVAYDANSNFLYSGSLGMDEPPSITIHDLSTGKQYRFPSDYMYNGQGLAVGP